MVLYNLWTRVLEWSIGMVSNLCLTLYYKQIYSLLSETTCIKRPLSLLPMSFLLTQILLYIASVSCVVLGGVAQVMGFNLARGKIFTTSIGLVDSLYPSVLIYCLNLHQFLILCSSKAMVFVKLYFRTSDIYLISLVPLDPSGFHLQTKWMPSIEKEPL